MSLSELLLGVLAPRSEVLLVYAYYVSEWLLGVIAPSSEVLLVYAYYVRA